jgi:DNA polymerase-3 subunit gamma/tau
MQALAEQVGLGQLMSWLKVFSNLDYQLKNSPYGQLPLELAVVELLVVPSPAATVVPAEATQMAMPTRTRQRVAPPAQPPVARPVAAPQLVVDATPEPPVIAATPTPEADTSSDRSTVLRPNVIEVEDNAAFPLEDVETLWPQFVEDLRAENRLIYAQMEGVMPINIEEQTVVLLASKGKWQKSMLEQEKTRRLLERMLTKALKTTAHIRITMDEQEEMPDVHKQLQHARNDPLVRKAINIFEADVIGIDTP